MNDDSAPLALLRVGPSERMSGGMGAVSDKLGRLGPMTDYSRPAKRSLTLCGHRTSVTLEEPFWRQFQTLAQRDGISVNALASRIDASRPAGVGLASAIRVYILNAALTAGDTVAAA